MSVEVVPADRNFPDRVATELEAFYEANPQIKESHGPVARSGAVHGHAVEAIACVSPPLPPTEAMEIRVAALLHDVDDRKYFPASAAAAAAVPASAPSSTVNDKKENATNGTRDAERAVEKQGAPPGKKRSSPPSLPNARRICSRAGIPAESTERIVQMIRWVGCSENGNAVPPEVESGPSYHLLIPRWSDRLEAVGAVGVVRCYQYSQEKGRPLCGESSTRATSAAEVYDLATPDRFDAYLSGGGGRSDDMISHYDDKLLHIARPCPEIVRNKYLEEKAEESAKELVEVCVRYGKTGKVDEEYILTLQKSLRVNG